MVAVGRDTYDGRVVGRLRHRPDLDGLRAVAILLVVGYHANVPGFAAGFMGVDVFFVLSGYLITRLIVAETDETGSLGLARFWARRARRLLPALIVVVGAVLVASQWIESPLQWRGTISEAWASLFYWSNHLFASEAGNYFAADLYLTPLLHMWSLAVEEQFYVVWPLVLWLPTRWASPGPPLARLRLVTVCALVALSLLVSMRLTGQGSPLAFYGAVSRAWEFGAGALLALTLGAGGSVLGDRTRRVLVRMGTGLLALALVLIDSETAFPFWTAALPVLGTVGLIVAEPTGGMVGSALNSKLAQTVGRLSYSWYLWHWPVIVLGTQFLEVDNVFARVALSGLALLPAAVSHFLVETPIRRSARLSASVLATGAVLAALTLSVVLVGSVARIRTDQILDDPLLSAIDSARHDFVEFKGACTSTEPEVVATSCVGGHPDGSRLVLVLGDSHATHWMPAVDVAATELGWRMTGSVRGACPSLPVPYTERDQKCEDRLDELDPLVDALAPDLVVMSHSVRYIGELRDPDDPSRKAADQAGLWERELTAFAESLRDDGVDLLVVLDVPRFSSDPIECLARAREVASCDLDRDNVRERLDPFHEAEIRALSEAGHGRYFDPLPLLCSDVVCPVFVDGRVAYTDSHHLTRSMSMALGDEIAVAMADSVGGREGR